MPTFSSKPYGRRNNGFLARLSPRISQRPILYFGLPFVLTITASSFVLAQFTQTRYDYNATRVQAVSKEDELRMSKDRRRIDVREEYFRLAAQKSEDEWDAWEPVRVPRPAGTPEWGVPPEADAAAGADKAQQAAGKSGWFSWARRGRLQAQTSSPEEAQRWQDAERQGISTFKRKEDSSTSQDGGASSIATAGATSKSGGGVILGPDGKPCRACNSKLAFAAAMKGATSTTAPRSNAASAPSAASSSQRSTESRTTDDCPPDVEALGNATWTFLHSAAAYYPTKPSQAQESSMVALLHALPHIYPCASCASALREEYDRETREGKGWEGREGITLDRAVRAGGPALRLWLCGLHNEVNARLGKPLFACTEETLRVRWRDGPPDGRCD